MNLEEIDIHEIIPQQEPFVMVGKLIAFDEKLTVTRTQIDSQNIFVEKGVFTASGIIENIAQTCAARIGYVNKYILKKGIQIGFIGAIRNLEIYHYPAVGEVIETAITVVEEVFGMTLVTATVKLNDDLVAEAEMKIAISQVESENQ